MGACVPSLTCDGRGLPESDIRHALDVLHVACKEHSGGAGGCCGGFYYCDSIAIFP